MRIVRIKHPIALRTIDTDGVQLEAGCQRHVLVVYTDQC